MTKLQKLENLIAEEFGADFLDNHTECYLDSDGIGYSLDTARGSVMVDWNYENFGGFYLAVYDDNEDEEFYHTTRKTLKGVKTYLQKYVE